MQFTTAGFARMIERAAVGRLEPNSCILTGHATNAPTRTKRPRYKGGTIDKTPREIIGDKNLDALEQAGYLVIHRAEMAKLRASLKSLHDSLSEAVPKAQDR